MNPQDFAGTWEMKTHGDGYYVHLLEIGVYDGNKVTGSWRHLSEDGGESSIDGHIDGDSVTLLRHGSGIRQTFAGRWAPTFAGGTYDNTGVFFMEKQ